MSSDLGPCPVCNGDCSSANPPVMFCPMQEVQRLAKNARLNNDLARMNAESMKRAMWRAAELANALESLCDAADFGNSGNFRETLTACRALLRRNDAANGVSNVE